MVSFRDFRRIFGYSSTEPAAIPQMGKSFIVDEETLEFFNDLTGTLEIQLTEPAQPIGGLLNVEAPPHAKLVSLHLSLAVFDSTTEKTRPLTDEELDRTVFEASEIRLQGESGEPVTHQAPNSTEFTVRDLIQAIEETERKTRGSTQWLGGIDVHHCFFEGLHESNNGSWEICWGS